MTDDRLPLAELLAKTGDADFLRAAAEVPAPRLHPGLAQVYRDRVAELARVLAQDDAAEARELIRGLVETITLIPEGGALRIEVRGALGAILALAEGARAVTVPQNAKRRGEVAEAFCVQVKLDAGTRNRRSQYITVRL